MQKQIFKEINDVINSNEDNYVGLQMLKYDMNKQRARKVMSDSPGLVDFVIGLVNSVLNLPDGQGKIFRRIKITKVL